MLHHTKAVRRGVRNALLVGDMPFMSYQVSTEEGIRNAGRFIQEGGANAVKLEGAGPAIELTSRLTHGDPGDGAPRPDAAVGEPVRRLRVQGTVDEAAEQILRDALALQDAGAFSRGARGNPGRPGPTASPGASTSQRSGSVPGPTRTRRCW